MVRVPDPVKVVEIDLPKVIEQSKESLGRFAESEFPGGGIANVSELANPADLIE